MTQAVNVAALGSTGVSTGFKNRIINGAMQIWQRGTSVAVSGDAYTGADRWKSGGQVWTGARSADTPASSPAQYSLEITSATGSYGTFAQRIESVNCADLVGKDVTFSIWVKNVFGSTAFYINVVSAPTADTWSGSVNALGSANFTLTQGTWQRVSVTITNLPSSVANGIQINMYNDSSAATVTRYTMAQFEVGTQATGFEFRPYSVELALCQRYYMQWVVAGYATLCAASPLDGSTSVIFLPLSVPLRASPSISKTGGFFMNEQTDTTATPVVNALFPNQLILQFGAMGATPWNWPLCRGGRSAGGAIYASAEL